ncbi:MAG: hypothetical protein IKS60_01485 [Lachnospiraceae bacterium]|nr:hypothetical protein [Lachnospiraceae bacterium]MBR5918181.1 hypothetical protein [Lachnospiraceae bacterium]
MTGKKLKIFNRTAALIISAALLSVYGCNNKGKTIDPDFYPTEVIEEEEEVTEAENTVSSISEVAPEKLTDEDILKPELNSLKENGKYEYNPKIIPDWILKQFENNPKIIRVAKQALVAIDNCETEFVIDDDLELTDDEAQYVYGVLYYSNPLSTVVSTYPSEEDPHVYKLSYFQQYALGEEDENGIPTSYQYMGESTPEEARVTIEAFKDYVTETINENLTSDMSDAEMASIIYKKLLTDIELEVESIDNYMNFNAQNYVSGEQITGVLDKKFTSGPEFVRLYSFFLTQLQIENREAVGTSGYFTSDLKTQLGEDAPISYYWAWQVLYLDGDYYNCDINLEAIVFKKTYMDIEGAEPDMLYFGMSDDKRNESYKVGKSSIYYADTIVYNNGTVENVPNCPKDLDIH